jgi:hypothetical protein
MQLFVADGEIPPASAISIPKGKNPFPSLRTSSKVEILSQEITELDVA